MVSYVWNEIGTVDLKALECISFMGLLHYGKASCVVFRLSFVRLHGFDSKCGIDEDNKFRM